MDEKLGFSNDDLNNDNVKNECILEDYIKVLSLLDRRVGLSSFVNDVC